MDPKRTAATAETDPKGTKPEDLTLGEIFSGMKVSTFWALIGGLVGALVATAGAGYWFAQKTNRPGEDKRLAQGGELPPAPAFPWHDGVIANFANAATHRPLNRLGENFNIISDAEWDGESSTKYIGMSQLGFDGKPGFLRIAYDLKPNAHYARMEGYGGVWTDLSFPPPKPLDISAFKAIAMRVRISDTARRPRVFVALASSNVDKVPDTPAYYDWCEQEIDPDSLQTDWVFVESSLDDFRSPTWSSRRLRLDPKKTFRLIISVKAHLDESIAGHVDIDDIRFLR